MLALPVPVDTAVRKHVHVPDPVYGNSNSTSLPSSVFDSATPSLCVSCSTAPMHDARRQASEFNLVQPPSKRMWPLHGHMADYSIASEHHML